MDALTLGLGAAVIVVVVLALSPRVGVSAPLVLVVLGVGLSLIPSFPTVYVDPEWILAGLLPPLLYGTSVSMPTMDFRRDLNAIAGLSVVLVVLTSVALGLLFTWLIPDLGLALGIALGAIISPTDAVATSIVRKLGVGPRIVTVLEGESLLNDASALVVLRTAIAATAATVSLWSAVGDFLYAVAVAAVIGGIVGRLSLWVRSRIADAHLTTAISFTVPFIAFLPAEHLGASGLVATVAAGLVTGYGSARHLRPQDRLTEAANWRTLELLLEGLVFLAMGIQLEVLVADVRDVHGSLTSALGLAAAAVVAVLVMRSLYVASLLAGLSRRSRRGEAAKRFLTHAGEDGYRVEDASADDLRRLGLGGGPGGPGRAGRPGRRTDARRTGPAGAQAPRSHRDGPGAAPETRLQRLRERITRRVADIDYVAGQPLGVREGAVLTWAGMRGVVTVAAAHTLPTDTPHRSLLVLVAFTVATGTLLLQGGTLGWLVRRLDLARRPGADGEELDALVARMQAAGAAALDAGDVRRPNGQWFDPALLARARGLYRRELTKVEVPPGADEAAPEPGLPGEDARAQLHDLHLAVIDAQRRELLRIRDLGTASSAALTRALAILDAEQIGTELRSAPE